MEYVHIGCVAWLTFNTLMTAHMVNVSISTGRRIARVSGIPLTISVAALITLGIMVIKEIV